MSIKFKAALLALAVAAPQIASAGNVATVQIYNNLYNQGGTAGAVGMTPSTMTVNYFSSGTTQCDTAVVGFRSLATEVIGTGSSQKCATISSVDIIAGASIINTALQVYSTTPVTITLTSADFEHMIIVQDLGTGVTGTAASDGSIAPVFDATNGLVSTKGTPGYILSESKLR